MNFSLCHQESRDYFRGAHDQANEEAGDHFTPREVIKLNGDSFEASAPSLRDVVRQVRWNGALLYFGDLDPEGLIILMRASTALAEFGLPALVPHVSYEQLIEDGNGLARDTA